MRPLRGLASALILAAGCSRASPPDPASARPDAAATSPSQRSASVQTAEGSVLSERITRAAPPRLVAIGDLHGDLAATRRALRLAGAIDSANAWIGGALVVVQTGDQIDRGDDDRVILDSFDGWRLAAKNAGGELISLNGNHEIMNVMLDFRYVTSGAYAPFADVRAEAPFGADVAGQFPKENRGRVMAFAPGGLYAKRLAERPLFVRVGDSFFVHGGLLDKHVAYGLDRMNDETRAFLNGKIGRAPPIVTSEDGPIWLRTYSTDPSPQDCAELAKTLARVGCKRLVVGHTVQAAGITEACGGAVWRIDVGLAKFYGGKTSVLEIAGDSVKPLLEAK